MKHILLVEDDPDLRDLLERVFDDMRYSVKAFPDCFKALEALRRSPGDFDLAFIDSSAGLRIRIGNTLQGDSKRGRYSPSKMNGYQLAREIKMTAPNIGVAMSISHYSADHAEKSEELNRKYRVNFIYKPFGLDELEDVVNRTMKGERIPVPFKSF